jgi:hypothetical protein
VALCVRDTILKEVQKFNGTLNAVMNMGLSGLGHNEKVSIAVAIFLKKLTKETQEGNGESSHYQFRDFDCSKWRLYKAWLVLKDTEKVAPPKPTKKHPPEEISSSEDDCNDNEGFITDSSGPRVASGILNSTTKGKRYKGQDAAKKSEAKAEANERKIAALDNIASTEKSKLKVIQGLKLQVKAQNMITMLNHPAIANNPTLSQRLYEKIMSAINEEDTTTTSEDMVGAGRGQAKLALAVAQSRTPCRGHMTDVLHNQETR